ncbi:MAG: tRNA (cytidine(34)-2'-O)-methyltransferase [Alcanivoracaceae bacterium]|jgi:tRNA (cytidine/uridine-2'-O-)-methyltransferase|nr:tRNA (cytidine(34)-2'-O)-methyltransferase [Alcanivoracaceae bacterium]
MIDIALYQPEIPPNTGNIMRLCANTGARLHLVKPLGFDLSEKKLRRAGLDYRDLASVTVHDSIEALITSVSPRRIIAMTTRASHSLFDARFRADDVLLFGPETRGLPMTLLDQIGEQNWLRIPMKPDSRSLNLSNSAAVCLYEAIRQTAPDSLR